MANRNEPCPCGSGKKYKACCARKRTGYHWAALISVVVFALLAAWVVAGVVRRVGTQKPLDPPPGKVWSEEHGHWHEEQTPGGERPLGPAPPGKVWSAEHGHWHDAVAAGTPQPPGPAPPGRVWSAEHGHWHDAATGAEPIEPPPAVADAPVADVPVDADPLVESVSYVD